MIALLYLLLYIVVACLVVGAILWAFEFFVGPIPYKVKVGIVIVAGIIVLIWTLRATGVA